MQIEEVGNILGKNSLLDPENSVEVPNGDSWSFDIGIYKQVLKKVIKPASKDISYVCPSFFEHGMPSEKINFIIETIGDTEVRMCRTIIVGDQVVFANMNYKNGQLAPGFCYVANGMVVGMILPEDIEDPSKQNGQAWTSERVILNSKEVINLVFLVHFYEKFKSTISETIEPGAKFMIKDGVEAKNCSNFNMKILST